MGICHRVFFVRVSLINHLKIIRDSHALINGFLVLFLEVCYSDRVLRLAAILNHIELLWLRRWYDLLWLKMLQIDFNVCRHLLWTCFRRVVILILGKVCVTWRNFVRTGDIKLQKVSAYRFEGLHRKIDRAADIFDLLEWGSIID